MPSNLFTVIIWPFLCSFLSGFVVYLIIECKDKKYWKKSEKKLINNLEILLNSLLTIIRTSASISIPKEKNVGSDYFSFIKEVFEYNSGYRKLQNELLKINQEKRETFLSDLNNAKQSLQSLLYLFMSFKKSENKYIEFLFELDEKINTAKINYLVFPEICDNTDDGRMIKIRNDAVNKIIELADFIIKIKDNIKLNTK